MYFRDSTFVAEWTDSNHGNINIEITDAKSQQKLVSDTVKGGYCEYDIDTKAHERIVVTLVPSESSNIEGAAQSKTMETLNDPDATITFENITITNKDSIKMYAKFGKPYSIEAYLNEKLVDKHTEVEAGDHDYDLPTEVGDNHYLIYVIDPETGYMKSTTYDLVKDVVAPVIKLEKSYENMTTEDESVLFEGYIDPDYETFTINDTPVKVEGDHTFKYEYSLKEGENNIRIEATDAAGNVADQKIVITRVIPQVAKVPWFPIILGVCLVGIVATYIIMMIVRRRRGYEEDSGHKRRGEKSDDGIPRDVIPVWAQDILRLAIPLAAVVIILRFVVCITSVMSGSMEPKLGVGNTVAYSRLAYVKHEPQRGDIILLWSDELNEYLAKRVIGIPGDEITFADGYVLINGELADESEYIAEDIETNCPKVFNVPEYTVFVLGDNREYSYDSRYWNNPYIKYSKIIGKYMGQTSFNVKYMIQQKIAEKKGESTKSAEDKMLDDSGAAVAPTEEEMSDAVEHSEEYEELTEASEVSEMSESSEPSEE